MENKLNWIILNFSFFTQKISLVSWVCFLDPPIQHDLLPPLVDFIAVYTTFRDFLLQSYHDYGHVECRGLTHRATDQSDGFQKSEERSGWFDLCPTPLIWPSVHYKVSGTNSRPAPLPCLRLVPLKKCSYQPITFTFFFINDASDNEQVHSIIQAACHIQGRGDAGADPSWHWGKAVFDLDRLPVLSQGP